MFAVYFVMHNQLCWPTKASYTVEMSGHDGPEAPYQGGGPATIGGDISKSTQNLISAMEEVRTLSKRQPVQTQPLSHGGGNKTMMSRMPFFFFPFFCLQMHLLVFKWNVKFFWRCQMQIQAVI